MTAGIRSPIDVERILVHVLADAGTSAVDVTTELPPDPGYPWGLLTLLPGGTQADGDHDDERLHRSRIEVQVFGDPDESVDGKLDSRTAMGELLDAALDAPGLYDLGVITAVRLEQDPAWLPDPSDQGPRYLAVLAVWSHPL